MSCLTSYAQRVYVTIVTIIMHQSFETSASATGGYPGQNQGFSPRFQLDWVPQCKMTGLRDSFARVLAVLTVLL